MSKHAPSAHVAQTDNVHSSRVWLGNQTSKKRKAEDQGEDDRPTRKHKNRSTAFSGNSRPKKRAIHPLKDQVRDLQRLLAKSGSNMLPTVLLEQERKLASLKQELVTTAAEKEKQKMIERYHMVRFFDRKKAERRLKKATKAVKSCSNPEELPKLEQDVHVAQIDLNYTMYSPLAKAYSALYPTNQQKEDGEEADEVPPNGPRGDKEMWLRVELATEEGTLHSLRNELDLDKARKTVPVPAPEKKQATGYRNKETKIENRGKGLKSTPNGSRVVRHSRKERSNQGGVKLDNEADAEEDGYFDE